jgi:hypothetical protein
MQEMNDYRAQLRQFGLALSTLRMANMHNQRLPI